MFKGGSDLVVDVAVKAIVKSWMDTFPDDSQKWVNLVV